MPAAGERGKKQSRIAARSYLCDSRECDADFGQCAAVSDPRKHTGAIAMPINVFSARWCPASRTAIGVVLSGMGSDGTLGIEAIKGEGGITFAQDEASAKYF